MKSAEQSGRIRVCRSRSREIVPLVADQRCEGKPKSYVRCIPCAANQEHSMPREHGIRIDLRTHNCKRNLVIHNPDIPPRNTLNKDSAIIQLCPQQTTRCQLRASLPRKPEGWIDWRTNNFFHETSSSTTVTINHKATSCGALRSRREVKADTGR